MRDMKHWSALVAALRSLTAADGRVTEQEEELVQRIFTELGCRDTGEPLRLDVQHLGTILTTGQDREDFVKLMLMVSLADGTTSPEEYAVIQKIGTGLGLSPERIEELRRETVLVEGS